MSPAPKTKRTSKPKSKSEGKSAANGTSFMPVSFKDFSKNPVVGTLFIALCGIGYMYMDGKNQNDAIMEAQNKKIHVLEIKVEKLNERVRKSDSLMSSAQAKINTLQELGKIK